MPPQIESEPLRGELFREVFQVEKPVIAMLHVWEGTLDEQRERLQEDIAALEPWVDGLLVENYGWGYLDGNRAEFDTAVRLRAITDEAVESTQVPVGVNVLPNDYEYALSIADRTGASFVQIDHVVGEFFGAKSVDYELLQGQRRMHPRIAVLGGIHPKYYKPKLPDPEITESAQEAARRGDAVVVTGQATGGETDLEELRRVKEVLAETPLVIGSGLDAFNAEAQLEYADGAIVGSAFKAGGVRRGESVDALLVEALMRKVQGTRSKP